MPEFIIILGGILTLFLPKRDINFSIVIASISCFGALLNSIGVAYYSFLQYESVTLFGTILIDDLSCIFKVFILFLGVVVVLSARRFSIPFPNIYYSLILFSTLSLLLIISGVEFILIFIALELLGVCFYALVGYLRNYAGLEASLKYFLYGELASATLLFGFSLLYLSFGTLDIREILLNFLTGGPPLLSVIGLIFVVGGLGFKIGYAPFHMWLPDTYEGAPTPFVSYLATASKVAGLILLIRLLSPIFLSGIKMDYFMILFSCLALTSMAIGNLAALHQKNIKRLLGYSSIGHIGYLLVGAKLLFVPNFTPEASQVLLFYLIVYSLGVILIFYIVGIVENLFGVDLDESYINLSKSSPLLAFGMLVGLASLAGLPPTAGFFGKLLLILVALKAKSYILAAGIIIFSLVSVYYYFRVIKSMYLEGSSYNPISLFFLEKTIIIFFISLIFLLCIYPQLIISIIGIK